MRIASFLNICAKVGKVGRLYRNGLLVTPFASQTSPGFNQNQIKEVVLDPVLVILGICGETTAVLIA